MTGRQKETAVHVKDNSVISRRIICAKRDITPKKIIGVLSLVGLNFPFEPVIDIHPSSQPTSI